MYFVEPLLRVCRRYDAGKLLEQKPFSLTQWFEANMELKSVVDKEFPPTVYITVSPPSASHSLRCLVLALLPH